MRFAVGFWVFVVVDVLVVCSGVLMIPVVVEKMTHLNKKDDWATKMLKIFTITLWKLKFLLSLVVLTWNAKADNKVLSPVLEWIDGKTFCVVKIMIVIV